MLCIEDQYLVVETKSDDDKIYNTDLYPKPQALPRHQGYDDLRSIVTLLQHVLPHYAR